MNSAHHRLAGPGLALLIAATLAACGGGSGDGTASSTGGSGGSSTATKTTFTGTVATGTALAGATVRIKCAAGSGNVVSGNDGSYTISIADATLPCVAQATSTDGKTVLHALADPAGGTTQALNINPLTELITAKVAAAAPATYFGSFDAATATKVTSTSLANAVTGVVATLAGGGVDFSAVGNPMTAPLVAKTATTAGNAYDQALDLLAQKLAQAGTTLEVLASAIAVPPAAGAVALTPMQMMQTAHPSCPALRSGTYRWIVPAESDPAWRAHKARLDAATLTMTWQDGSSSQATALGGCAFAAEGGRTRLVVAPSGVLVSTWIDEVGRQGLSVGFPEQATQLADLAGTWNVLEFSNVGGASASFVNGFTVAEIAADGKHLSLAECDGLSACVPLAGPFGSFRANPGGGFDYVEPTGTVSSTRFFVLRNAAGEPTLFAVDSDGSVMVGSRQAARALPAVGTVSSRWDTSVSAANVVSPFTEATYTVTAVDAAAQTYTRRTEANGVLNTFVNNQPRNGLLYRAPATATTNTGASVTVNELISLPLPGTGVIVYGRVTTPANRNTGFFGVGVVKPDGASGTTAWPAVGSGGAAAGGPAVTSMNFIAAAPARLEVTFSEPMSPTYFTTGSYVPTSSVWETSTKFVITFSSYSPGGFITLKARTASDPRGFISASGTPMANDVNFQFP